MPYYHPHSLRDTLAHFAMEKCATPEEFKAVSQNLAHNSVLTTLTSYGEVSHVRQGKIVRCLGKPELPKVDLEALVREVAALKERDESR